MSCPPLVTVFEWDTCERPDLSFSSEQNRRLAQKLTAGSIVQITELRAGLRIESNSHIGRVDLGDFTLQINPKLDDLPLLRLLIYAYGLRDLKFYDQALYKVALQGWDEWLVFLLQTQIEELWRRGLTKGYAKRSEYLTTLRGRIDFGKIAAQGGLIAESLPCIYFQREENILLNQTLLAGLLLGRNMVRDLNLKLALSRTITILRDSIRPVKLDQPLLTRAKRSLNRISEDYRPLLEIIEILCQAQAPHLDQEGQTTPFAGFFLDMNRFFEAMVSKLLKLLPERITVYDQYRLKDLMCYDPLYNPRKRRPPTPQPDFAFIKEGRVVRFLDAKYRDLWEKPLPRDMLYQLAIYALSGQDKEYRRSTIIFPALNDNPKIQKINIFDAVQDITQGVVEMVPLNLKKISDFLEKDKTTELADYIQSVFLTEEQPAD